VQSRVGAATAERGGRRKRLYRVTASGATALSSIRAIRSNLWRAIEAPVRP
jgi:DNA-binding PadR family transcriptional regulator